MLNTVISQVSSALKATGIKNVFTAFDNIPLTQKPDSAFTVISVDSLESKPPIYSEYRIFIPFQAETGISVIASEKTSLAELYSFFDCHILPVLQNIGGLSCSLKKLTVKYDSNIKRMILKICFSASGICTVERSSS